MAAFGPLTLARTGQDVLFSSRGVVPDSPGADLPGRRRAAVKKAFKRVDPLGSGFAALEDVKQALSLAPLVPTAQQKLVQDMERATQRRPDGRTILPYSAFVSYYTNVSRAIQHDLDFEQLLHSQWGFADVSDVLVSMQRQFALIGFAQVFQECPGEVGPPQFEAAMRRAGMTPRKDDLQRLSRAFGGRNGAISMEQFRDQVLAPRPETPPPVGQTRDLAPLGPPAPAWTTPVGSNVAAPASPPRPAGAALPALVAGPNSASGAAPAPAFAGNNFVSPVSPPRPAGAQMAALATGPTTASSSPPGTANKYAMAAPSPPRPTGAPMAAPGMSPMTPLVGNNLFAAPASPPRPAGAPMAAVSPASPPRPTGAPKAAFSSPRPPGAPMAAPAAGPSPASGVAQDVSDADLDAMLNKMEGHLHSLRTKQTAGQTGPPGSALGAKPAVGNAPPGMTPSAGAAAQPDDGPVSDADLDAMLSKMEGHLHRLKVVKAAGVAGGAAGNGSNLTDGPVSDADLDAALSHLENHINTVKNHKPVANAQPHWDDSAPVEDPPDMPHWEHHKYDHHQITAPEWKPENQVSDMYGHQHAAAEYGYNNFGAGPHGHHVAHFHLNDYGTLAHHEFKQEEYAKQTFGDAQHHGHWVPHLHGIGTKQHHGEHEYNKDEYGNQAYGEPGHHGHWVPHLHGVGNVHPGVAAPPAGVN